MFSYYGGKAGIVHHYPPPKYDYVVEPFCGSAAYACKYGLERDVWINDKYKVIYRIWKWIQQATSSDIKSLPNLKKGQRIVTFTKSKILSYEEKLFLGFCVGRGRSTPCRTYTRRAAENGAGGTIARKKKQALNFVDGRISHWKITNLDFRQVRNTLPSTYFVDPPYQVGGHSYKVNNRKGLYKQVRIYCSARLGQIIVCEGSGATWWNFEHLVNNHCSRGMRTEMIKVLHNV